MKQIIVYNIVEFLSNNNFSVGSECIEIIFPEC